MDEKVKSFLLYGADTIIEKKELYKMDGVILFFMVLLFTINEVYGGSAAGRVFCILFPLSFGILTFSKTDVTGEKVFWVYGIWGSEFSILFGLFGTIIILPVIDKAYYVRYFIVLFAVYAFMILLYIGMVVCFIKKDIYRSKAKKLFGSWFFTLFGMAGIAAAKILHSGIGQEKMVWIGGMCSYFVSLMSVLGSGNLIKYILIKKRRNELCTESIQKK